MDHRARSRSPRRGQSAPPCENLPLADLLFTLGVLDERSVDFLKKAPLDVASSILMSLGPDVRNPSAFVTRKLGQKGVAGVGMGRDGDAARQQDGTGDAEAVRNHGGGAHRNGSEDETFEVHFQGGVHSLKWISHEQAAEELLTLGILDQGSTDFLLKAPEAEAKRIVAMLGPDVRNPSALVTRKLKELRHGGGVSETSEPVTIHVNGAPTTFNWVSKEQAAELLSNLGVLDARSAEYLTQTDESTAKQIVSSIGPEVRNASAFVTKQVNLLGSGGFNDVGKKASAWTDARKPLSLSRVETITFFFEGEARSLEWRSLEQAIQDLLACAILDTESADFLSKAPEAVAKQIIGSLGPEVRNPSAYITKRLKALNVLQNGAGNGASWKPRRVVETITIYPKGKEMRLECHSLQTVLDELFRREVLDESSSNFLGKIPESKAWDIIAGIDADVRNPSAYVTKEAKKWK